MQSKILIDVNEQGEPVIKVSHFSDRLGSSDDVRDKLVRRFKEDVSGRWGLMNLEFINDGIFVVKPSSLDIILFSLRAGLSGRSLELLNEIIDNEFGGGDVATPSDPDEANR